MRQKKEIFLTSRKEYRAQKEGTYPERSELFILVSLDIVPDMSCSGWDSPAKNYGLQGANLLKRKAYLHLRERYHHPGKEFVYINESGLHQRSCAGMPTPLKAAGIGTDPKHQKTAHLVARGINQEHL